MWCSLISRLVKFSSIPCIHVHTPLFRQAPQIQGLRQQTPLVKSTIIYGKISQSLVPKRPINHGEFVKVATLQYIFIPASQLMALLHLPRQLDKKVVLKQLIIE